MCCAAAVYFGYYTRLVTDLLSKEEDFLPFASQSSGLSRSRCVEVKGKDTIEQSYGVLGTSLGNSVGTGLSDFKKEISKSLLRQGVKVLACSHFVGIYIAIFDIC